MPALSHPSPPRRALVTGAGKRLGRVIAEHLGALGARVALFHHESAVGAEAARVEICARGGEARAFQADLQERESARERVDAAIDWLGGLDLLVLSAASFERIPYAQLEHSDWERTLNLNLTAAFTLSQQCAPHLARDGGSIVAITCSSTVTPFRNHLPYVVAKSGLLQLVRTLALELAPRVRANAVAPGLVLAPDSMTPEEAARLASRVPLETWGRPEDVAEAVAYLASARFVTGQQLVIDGGRSLA